MTADEDGVGGGQAAEIGFQEVADDGVDARRPEFAGVLFHQFTARFADFERGDFQLRELQPGFDGDRAGAETHVPERSALRQVEPAEGQQPDGHLGDHIHPAVEQGEILFRQAEGMRPQGRPLQDQAVRKSAVGGGGFGERGEGAHPLGRLVTQALPDRHPIVVVAVVAQAAGDHRRRLVPVGQRADEPFAPDDGFVEAVPGPPGQRHRPHIGIRQLHPMGQQLQGIERGIYRNLRFGEFPAEGIGKSEEKRIAGGEDHHFRMAGVLFEHRFKRRRDVDPAGAFGQQGRHDLVVALSAREDAAFCDDIADLGREPDLPLVGHSDDREMLTRGRLRHRARALSSRRRCSRESR